jgi:RNA polymerase sigma factor (sigma-70 family)
MAYTNTNTDIELLEGCRRQDRQAQYLLYKRFFGRVMSISLRYAGNRQEAVEITNTVFLKVMTLSDSYEQTGPVGAWIGKIALYSSIDFVRQKNTHQRHYVATDVTPDSPIRNEAIDRLSEEELLGLIQQLPVIQRTVFCLFAIEGFSHEEIGEQLHFPAGTSKWHLSQARTQLKKMLTSATSRQEKPLASPAPKNQHQKPNTQHPITITLQPSVL